MSRTRICLNCAFYETLGPNVVQDWAPRCTKGLNPALGHANKGDDAKREQGAFEPDAMAAFCDTYIWAPHKYQKFRKTVLFNLGKWKGNFSTAELPEKFIPYYEKGANVRIKIERGINMRYNEHGYVSMSTGWQPCFLLMRSVKARLSSVVLKEDDDIVAVREWSKKSYRRVIA